LNKGVKNERSKGDMQQAEEQGQEGGVKGVFGWAQS
jgi:hypothetical protein